MFQALVLHLMQCLLLRTTIALCSQLFNCQRWHRLATKWCRLNAMLACYTHLSLRKFLQTFWVEWNIALAHYMLMSDEIIVIILSLCWVASGFVLNQQGCQRYKVRISHNPTLNKKQHEATFFLHVIQETSLVNLACQSCVKTNYKLFHSGNLVKVKKSLGTFLRHFSTKFKVLCIFMYVVMYCHTIGQICHTSGQGLFLKAF